MHKFILCRGEVTEQLFMILKKSQDAISEKEEAETNTFRNKISESCLKILLWKEIGRKQNCWRSLGIESFRELKWVQFIDDSESLKNFTQS